VRDVAEDAVGGDTGTGGGVIIRCSVVVNIVMMRIAVSLDTATFQRQKSNQRKVVYLSDDGDN